MSAKAGQLHPPFSGAAGREAAPTGHAVATPDAAETGASDLNPGRALRVVYGGSVAGANAHASALVPRRDLKPVVCDASVHDLIDVQLEAMRLSDRRGIG